MARCLELAERYRGRTSPNPIVGCVIVDRAGKVIAEGAHAGPGTPHAEIAALAKLKHKAKGATLYVNLEPCTHQGRTPPCAPVVRDSGVARVVIGMEDPVPGHGGGTAVLKRAKVAVTSGVLREDCERANLPFVTWAREGRPAFTLKAAITLDGKIATVAGESQWITGEAARADVMRLRTTHDAVMVGIGTVLADDPQLTARVKGARDPIRIVLDGELRTPPMAKLLDPSTSRTSPSAALAKLPRVIIVTGTHAPTDREAALIARGADVWCVPDDDKGQLDVTALARMLGESGITSVLVEGGGEVHASLLDHQLADQLVLYVAPRIVGGPAKSWVGGAGLPVLASAHAFVFDDAVVRLGDDLRFTALARPVPEGT
ncbi:MAG: bifunctional diaminohydroxyphosphoribosylaminopyrimidine deaminase/5-amino-6-(5-phosphoribosylamino)uracil reductase RibD [Deltaproteobacteria bacterium]|nr:bifunctional diaminohydroxyphosphoribosylaminopyrimidine deaminase/5-amino-6-(5-phosphoribosylamino)uracil reductase RibD [Deltaproteobacteria bacterium]